MDKNRDDVLVEMFIVDLELGRDISNTTTLTGQFHVATITLKFEVSCSENHFGEDCNVICEETNDINGHYACDREGNVICLPGFVDPSNHCICPASEPNCKHH